MSYRPIAFLAAALALLSGCATGPSLNYRVDFAHRDSTGVPVTLEIAGVRRDSLVLEGYLQTPLMTVRDVVVEGEGGRATPVPVTLRTLDDGLGGEADFPVLRLSGPLPPRLTLHYRAVLGGREGNAHTGFTGRAAGFASERYAFAGGRSLFLVPSPINLYREIAVRFELPAGWMAVTPWRRDGDAFRVGNAGGSPVEELLRSPLGFGRFSRHDVARNGTTYHIAIESGVGDADRDSADRAYETIVHRVTDAFERPLGADFTLVIVPPLDDGDEIITESWATAAGGTLAPITTARALRVAESLVDAHLGRGPFRTTVKDAREAWIVPGVTRLLPWRALEAAGLARHEDVTRWIASDYAHETEDSDSSDVEHDLEQLSTSELDMRPAQDVLAPLALLRVDGLVRDLTSGRDSLETVLRRVFAGHQARSLWRSLPEPSDPRWMALRDRYVLGQGDLRQDTLFAAPSPTETPGPPRGPAVRRLTLALTGNTNGFLENCGCKTNQAGGVARRATVFARYRRQGPVLALDAGNAMIQPERMTPPDYLALEEEKLYLGTMTRMGYPLAALGPAELGYGLERFHAAAGAAGFPFLTANAHDSAGTLGPAWRKVEAGGVRVGVIGLIEPGRGPWANDVLERHLGRAVRFGDPLDALRRVLPEVRAASDLVIAMGYLSPPTVQRIAAGFPDVDVVVSSDDEALARVAAAGDPEAQEATTNGDAQGFYGRTLVLYTTQSSFGLNGATLGLDAGKRIASAELFASWLGDSVPDDRATRDELSRFYDRVGRTQAAQASVPPLFTGDPARFGGPFAGAAACLSCHASEHAQWKDTSHASAYKTLLDIHRHYQPRCVVCHVVGLGTPSGYQLGSADTRLVGVQCEICHGNGAAHARSPSRTNIARQVPERVCLECHTPDHSDHFVYADRLPLVMHQQIKTIDVGAGGASR